MTALLERADALATLEEALDEASAGRGRVVVVSGEAGIGKTALVGAFVAAAEQRARVLVGSCDDLSVQRPLAPLHDLVGSVSPDLDAAIRAGDQRLDVHRLLAVELDRPPRPVMLVLEDLHWADDATLDALTYVVRRVPSLPGLIVLTVRSSDAAPDHPLHALLGAAPAPATEHIALAPLSEAAVETLMGGDGAGVHALTGGNPFYVSELIAYGDAGGVPPTVANAVRGRASRLTAEERRLLDVVALVPGRAPARLLDDVLPGWTEAAEEPERRQLLEIDSRWIRFRHELARAAIESEVPTALARTLHARIVDVLVAAGGDPAEIVHHAERAGRDDIVAEFVLVAARRAAAIEANREAYAHYHQALDHLEGLPADERARALEEVSAASWLVARFAEAIATLERAIAIWDELGDRQSVGRCRRALARLHWFAGDGVLARAQASEAVGILESFGPSSELAVAYGMLARLAMLEADGATARVWATRALSFADTRARVNALVTIATVDIGESPVTDTVESAYAEAVAAGLPQEAAVVLGNAADILTTWGLPRRATPYVERALAHASEFELHHMELGARTLLSLLQLRAGDWSNAEQIASEAAAKGASVSELHARRVLAELAVRRGDVDAAARVAEVAVRAVRAGDPTISAAMLELQVELSLTSAEEAPVARLQEMLADHRLQGQVVLRVAAAAAMAGLDVPAVGWPDVPYALVAGKEWRAAADAFGREGWAYDRALLLSFLDDEEALGDALAIARRLGAEPLVRRASTRLRALGHVVPRGPRGATRTNPAGLTPRQVEVLGLLVDGLTNAEIADRLFVTRKTAEHHVAAVLAKLGVDSRVAAARRAAELGLVAPKDP